LNFYIEKVAGSIRGYQGPEGALEISKYMSDRLSDPRFWGSISIPG